MNNKVLVAYDNIGPRWPLQNNRNMYANFDKMSVDFERGDFFKHIKTYKIFPTLSLEENDVFIYPVWVGYHPGSWLYDYPEDLFKDTDITHETVELIRNHNGYLFVDISQESPIYYSNNKLGVTDSFYKGFVKKYYDMSESVVDYLHMAIKLQHIPLNKVILQVGNPYGKKAYDEYCIKKNIPREEAMHISCIEHFEWRTSSFLHANMQTITKKDHRQFETIKKTFLCLNRHYRWHRINLFLLWDRFNLLDDSYYSMYHVNRNSGHTWKVLVDQYFVKMFGVSTNSIDDLQNKLPLKLDDLTVAWDMAQISGGLDYLYDLSLISVVTETNFADNTIFNTEKIFKPIFHQHPFIMVGPYKTLENLRSLGYQTFSDFWDESYDDIEDPRTRLIKIVQLCKDINEWSDDRKKEFFYASKNITKHNFNLLKSIYPNNMRRNFWHDFSDNMRII